MTTSRKLRSYLYATAAPLAFGMLSFTATGAAAAPCQGPGAPTTTQTKCLTAITIPGNPLQSYDISWVNPDRAEYYLADRSNFGITIIDTQHLKFKRTIAGFVGVKFNATGTAADNAHSGPNGVVSHGRWLYAGDGDSTLKVIDLDAPTASAIKQIIPTGGTTRANEMALSTDGRLLLLGMNTPENPPFATLFAANGDAHVSNVTKIARITVDPAIMPPVFSAFEQPSWDPKTQRFYASIPIVATNPPGCNFNSALGPVTCSGGFLVVDPAAPKAVYSAYDPVTNTGVLPLNACGPNGSTVGVDDDLLFGCTPGNFPAGTTTVVINAKTHNYANVAGIVGSDEVFFNKGDSRYYLGASKAIKPAGSPLGSGAVLGVVGRTSILIETVPVSSGSHSVAADSRRNLIFVPQNFTRPVTTPLNPSNVGTDVNFIQPGSTTTVGQLICGGVNGCIAVYRHDVDEDDEDHDHDDHDRR